VAVAGPSITMKLKMTDVVFIVTCMTLSAVALAGYTWRAQAPMAREGIVREDQRYPLAASSARDRTVVVYIHPDCRFCNDAIPFYRRLAALAPASASELRFQSTVTQEELRRYLVAAGFARPVIASGPIPIGVRGTPTIVVFDRLGGPIASWEGRLNRRQERTVLEYFRPDSKPGPTPALERTR